MKKQICIIGAGAAGLIAASSAADNGAKIVIVDSNTTAGRKLLKTGGGRCNVTNDLPVNDFLRMCEPYSRFLRHSVYEFSPQAVCEYFKSRGLAMQTQPDGCVFPLTNRASDVLRILVDDARRKGVEFVYGKQVESVYKGNDHFIVQASGLSIESDRVIIATGGCSLPATGSTGMGLGFAKQLGHSIVTPTACLVPLVIKEEWVNALAGVAINRAVLSSPALGKKSRLEGPLVFTANGIGGPAVLNFSRHIVDQLKDGPVEINIDFLPEMDQQQADQMIIEKVAQNPKRELAGIFVNILPRSLAICLCSNVSGARNLIANQLTRQQRMELVDMLKKLTLTVVALRPIAEATVTRGGVSNEEIDSKTMQSQIVTGLYFAGEVIDADGPCGGYNLQIAWSTGALAGKSAAQSLSL